VLEGWRAEAAATSANAEAATKEVQSAAVEAAQAAAEAATAPLRAELQNHSSEVQAAREEAAAAMTAASEVKAEVVASKVAMETVTSSTAESISALEARTNGSTGALENLKEQQNEDRAAAAAATAAATEAAAANHASVSTAVEATTTALNDALEKLQENEKAAADACADAAAALTTAREASEVALEARTMIEQSTAAASQAQETADGAHTAAGAASEDAAKAVTTSERAVTTAEDALAQATAAHSAAAQASEVAFAAETLAAANAKASSTKAECAEVDSPMSPTRQEPESLLEARIAALEASKSSQPDSAPAAPTGDQNAVTSDSTATFAVAVDQAQKAAAEAEAAATAAREASTATEAIAAQVNSHVQAFKTTAAETSQAMLALVSSFRTATETVSDCADEVEDVKEQVAQAAAEAQDHSRAACEASEKACLAEEFVSSLKSEVVQAVEDVKVAGTKIDANMNATTEHANATQKDSVAATDAANRASSSEVVVREFSEKLNASVADVDSKIAHASADMLQAVNAVRALVSSAETESATDELKESSVEEHTILRPEVLSSPPIPPPPASIRAMTSPTKLVEPNTAPPQPSFVASEEISIEKSDNEKHNNPDTELRDQEEELKVPEDDLAPEAPSPAKPADEAKPPVPAKFTASDGTPFQDRREFRKYEFELSFTFKKQAGEPGAMRTLRKDPGSIDGQPFEMAELKRCEVLLLDHSEAVQVDYLEQCNVFIGACCDSVFVRNCTGCTFTIACKQLRTRDCKDCTFYLFSLTEPVIELSSDVRFAPFNGAYAEHLDHMEAASLGPLASNLWFAVFDFNDDAKTGDNWRLLEESEEDGVWALDTEGGQAAAMTTSTVPRVAAGSIPVPSEEEAKAGGGMKSFALGTSQEDAEKALAEAEEAGVVSSGEGAENMEVGSGQPATINEEEEEEEEERVASFDDDSIEELETSIEDSDEEKNVLSTNPKPHDSEPHSLPPVNNSSGNEGIDHDYARDDDQSSGEEVSIEASEESSDENASLHSGVDGTTTFVEVFSTGSQDVNKNSSIEKVDSAVPLAYSVGDRVQVWWEDEGAWFSGAIAKSSGTDYDILYDDGDTEDGVEVALIRPEFPAEIVDVNTPSDTSTTQLVVDTYLDPSTSDVAAEMTPIPDVDERELGESPDFDDSDDNEDEDVESPLHNSGNAASISSSKSETAQKPIETVPVPTDPASDDVPEVLVNDSQVYDRAVRGDSNGTLNKNAPADDRESNIDEGVTNETRGVASSADAIAAEGIGNTESILPVVEVDDDNSFDDNSSFGEDSLPIDDNDDDDGDMMEQPVAPVSTLPPQSPEKEELPGDTLDADSQVHDRAMQDDIDGASDDVSPVDDKESNAREEAATEAHGPFSTMTGVPGAELETSGPPSPDHGAPIEGIDNIKSVLPEEEDGDNSFDGDDNSSFGEDSLPIDDNDDGGALKQLKESSDQRQESLVTDSQVHDSVVQDDSSSSTVEHTSPVDDKELNPHQEAANEADGVSPDVVNIPGAKEQTSGPLSPGHGTSAVGMDNTERTLPKVEDGSNNSFDDNSSFGEDSLPIDDDNVDDNGGDNMMPPAAAIPAIPPRSPEKEGGTTTVATSKPSALKPPASPPSSPGSDAYSEESFEEDMEGADVEELDLGDATAEPDEPNSGSVAAALERSRALRARVSGEPSSGEASPVAPPKPSSESSLEEVDEAEEMIESFDFDEEGPSETAEPESNPSVAASESIPGNTPVQNSPGVRKDGDQPIDLSDSEDDDDEPFGKPGKTSAASAGLSFEDQISGAAFAIRGEGKGNGMSPALRRRLQEDGGHDGGEYESEGTNS